MGQNKFDEVQFRLKKQNKKTTKHQEAEFGVYICLCGSNHFHFHKERHCKLYGYYIFMLYTTYIL